MKCNEQNKLTKSRNRLIDTENRLTAVRGEGVGGMGGKVEGIEQKKKILIEDMTWCSKHTIQYIDDVF